VLAVEHPFHEADHRNHAQFGDLQVRTVSHRSNHEQPGQATGVALARERRVAYLVKTDRVEHEAKVHPGDGGVGDEREPDELPQRDVLGDGVTGGVGDPPDERGDGEVEPGQRGGCARRQGEQKHIVRSAEILTSHGSGSRSASRYGGKRDEGGEEEAGTVPKEKA
jgi:hypothetical protein